MNSWAKRIEQGLKNHDSLLFLQESKLGRYDVYRKTQFGEAPPNLICSLTDDWSVKGSPVEYGLYVVLDRIKAHDLWRDDSFIENWIKEREKEGESRDRARRNSIESFLYDFRSQFQRATDGINTGSLNKIDSRKLMENKNGNC